MNVLHWDLRFESSVIAGVYAKVAKYFTVLAGKGGTVGQIAPNAGSSSRTEAQAKIQGSAKKSFLGCVNSLPGSAWL